MTMTNDGHNMGRERENNLATYASFMSMTKWGIILVVIVLLLMAVFLV
jgi:Bacterial aa3 type cytochrome c oxidase subunit IV